MQCRVGHEQYAARHHRIRNERDLAVNPIGRMLTFDGDLDLGARERRSIAVNDSCDDMAGRDECEMGMDSMVAVFESATLRAGR